MKREYGFGAARLECEGGAVQCYYLTFYAIYLNRARY